MTAVELDLDAIEARFEHVTDGPWTTGEDGLVWPPHTGDPVSGSIWLPDARFIAAARTDVPALVAEVRRLRAELQLATDQRDAHKAMADELRRDLDEADDNNGFLQRHIADIRAGRA